MSRRPAAAIGGLALALGALAACGSDDTEEPTKEPIAKEPLVRVPADADTIQAAVDRVAEDGLVLVDPGTYPETVTITTDGVTLRGTDRNGVVIDGEAQRSNGIVATGERVRIENLTVRNNLVNGVLVTGVTDEDGGGIGRGSSNYEPFDTDQFPPRSGFLVQYVTSNNNGLYGIYAFNRRDGAIRHNYASGGADSGIYVGQCPACNVLVSDNVMERNAIGYENANATGVSLVGNRIVRNRVGVSLLTSYQEAYVPQGRALIAGNLIADNAESDTPEQAEGAFGIGIGLAGATGVQVTRNRISGNPQTGIAITDAEDVESGGTEIEDNTYADNAADIAAWKGRAGVADVCIEELPGIVLLPTSLRVDGCTDVDGTAGAPSVTVPPGISFLDVELPGALPDMPGELTEVEEFDFAAMTVDLSSVTVPAASFTP